MNSERIRIELDRIEDATKNIREHLVDAPTPEPPPDPPTPEPEPSQGLRYDPSTRTLTVPEKWGVSKIELWSNKTKIGTQSPPKAGVPGGYEFITFQIWHKDYVLEPEVSTSRPLNGWPTENFDVHVREGAFFPSMLKENTFKNTNRYGTDKMGVRWWKFRIIPGVYPGKESGVPDEPVLPAPPSRGLSGHPLFMEAQGPTNYNLPNSWLALTINRFQKPGDAPCAVWHPMYAPEHGTDPQRIQKFIDAGPRQWRRTLIDTFVSDCVRMRVSWAGNDWEGALNLPAFLPVLEDQSRELRSNGIKVIHWPADSWSHQVRSGQFRNDDQAWGWAMRHMDAIGFWHPSSTWKAYQTTVNQGRAAGFKGQMYQLAYPLKGVGHDEDVAIASQPTGGIFNPKGHYALVTAMRRMWA